MRTPQADRHTTTSPKLIYEWLFVSGQDLVFKVVNIGVLRFYVTHLAKQLVNSFTIVPDVAVE